MAGGSAAPTQTPGSPKSAHPPDLVSRSLSQSHHPGEPGLFAEARGTHAVPHLSASRLADWLGQRGKCQQGGRRSTVKRSGHALGAAQRQSHAGAAQRRLQSALARDVDDRESAATSTAHESAASRQPPAAQPCLLDPRVLGSTAGSAVPATCPSCHFTDNSCQCAATRSSSWHWLFLAQTLSQTSSLQPCGFS